MNLISLLCFLLLIIHGALPLSCNHCNDASGWDSCAQKTHVAQCDYILTGDLHRDLANLNPTLPVIPPALGLTWQCYELAVQFTISQGSSSRMYERGCTYAEADFCNGWDPVALQPPVICSVTFSGVTDVNDGGIDSGSGTEGVANGGIVRIGPAVCGWVLVLFYFIIAKMQLL